jgi:ABC-type phosphate/phosphonate transport system substrate-binding protein
MNSIHRTYLAFVAATAVFFGFPVEARPVDALLMVVMDPLAKPLSCPCVAGYAQRDYEKLAESLEKRLGHEIKLVFNESLTSALKAAEAQAAGLVIGKQSVILHDAKAGGLTLKKVAMLTGKDGLTTQRGLFVVAAKDRAQKMSDLPGYRIFFGPTECDEKHAAAMQLLRDHKAEVPVELDTAIACDEGAIKILELAEKGERGAAVISSYAKPLLEGCGQVQKGALRVVGETEEIPFIAAFVDGSLDKDAQAKISDALIKATSSDIHLRIALETKRGFVADEQPTTELAKKK